MSSPTAHVGPPRPMPKRPRLYLAIYQSDRSYIVGALYTSKEQADAKLARVPGAILVTIPSEDETAVIGARVGEQLVRELKESLCSEGSGGGSCAGPSDRLAPAADADCDPVDNAEQHDSSGRIMTAALLGEGATDLEKSSQRTAPAPCNHAWTHHPDPSGNNDCHWSCACGARTGKDPSPEAVQRRREVAAGIGVSVDVALEKAQQPKPAASDEEEAKKIVSDYIGSCTCDTNYRLCGQSASDCTHCNSKGVDGAIAAALARARQPLLNLLARIHRDGGHYTEKHGIDKAVADADQIAADLIAGKEATLAPFISAGLANADGTVRKVPRPSVYAFAERMEETLRCHDARKGGQSNWRKDTPSQLANAMVQEVQELLLEINDNRLVRAASEAIDVANFALMIADACDPLPNDEAVQSSAADKGQPT